MKKIPFKYDGLTSEEAELLVRHYKDNGYRAVRSLSSDPKYWDVVVTLYEQHYLKPTPRSMVNRMWR
ncbi:hypothetical protein [Symbiopectobacterium purcellii]|uniref:Uncharacterized protein n=1 Tax=Symbiopectobacterium purcellii TaxID=2871826 RepID=A0ABX9AMM0_9ENTR|nr:hypothetical protein [Symbiopectobacterium purcellii]QZN96445.1 hypothetical protein K6K13_02980 [Symbiopectobacterium purcellii]